MLARERRATIGEPLSRLQIGVLVAAFEALKQMVPRLTFLHLHFIIFCDKQYKTVDNSSKLLYTVYKSHGISYEEVKDMHIILNNSSMIPIYEQIVDQVKNQIIAAEILENEALPSVRALSAELKISALTVKKAYDRLEEEGFVVTVHGKGTFVAATDLSLIHI